MDHRTSRIVTFFPGQGAFDGPALADAAAAHPGIRTVFDEIDEVTLAEAGRPLSAVVLSDSPPSLAQLQIDEPWVSQLAIYGTGVATYRVLHEQGLRPDVLLGHSLGEVSALAAAGVYSIADGARVVLARTRAVGRADLRGGYMAALSTGVTRAEQLIAVVGDDHLAVAVQNHDGQTVVSGPGRAMDALLQVASAVGVPFVRLESPAPFHGPLMTAASREFADAISGIATRDPQRPVHSPILGRLYTGGDDVRAALPTHLVLPVRFGAAVRALHADGARRFVECGAKTALSKATAKALADSEHSTVSCLADAGLSAAVGTLRASGLLPAEAASQAAAPSAIGTGDAEWDAFWAAREHRIVDSIRREFEAFRQAAPAPDATPVLPAEPASPVVAVPAPAGPVAAAAPSADATPAPEAAAPSRTEVAGQVRTMYADALEYPIEVFTDEVELEAELGIDSVKQVEMLTRVSTEYGLPMQDGGFRLRDVDTMGKVIDYTITRLGDQEPVDV